MMISISCDDAMYIKNDNKCQWGSARRYNGWLIIVVKSV